MKSVRVRCSEVKLSSALVIHDCLFSHKLTFWLKGVESLDPKYSSVLLISSYMHRLSVLRLLFHLCHQRREREKGRERDRDIERTIDNQPTFS